MTLWRSSLSLIALTILFCTPSIAQEKTLHQDSLLGIVGDQLITTNDVTSTTRMGEEFLSMKYIRNKALDPLKRDALEDEIVKYRHAVATELVNREVIYREFNRLGFRVPEELVELRVASIVKQRAGGDEQKFNRWLRDQQMTPSAFRSRLRKRVAVELYTAQEVDRRITVSPREIQDYYDLNQDNYRVTGKVTLQMLSFASKPLSAEDKATAIKTIQKSLDDGMNFADAVKRYSLGHGRETGGFQPETAYEDLAPSFRNAIKGLKQGQTSASFEHDGNVIWLHVTKLVSGRLKTIDEVRNRIRQEISQSQRARLFREFVRNLRRKTYTRLYFPED